MGWFLIKYCNEPRRSLQNKIFVRLFKSNYQLIAIDISKQKVLDANPVADQQIEVNVDLRKKLQICTILGKSKKTTLVFFKRTAKVF